MAFLSSAVLETHPKLHFLTKLSLAQEKDKNGDADSSRDRSPIRSDSSPQIIEVNPAKPDLVKTTEPSVLDMRVPQPHPSDPKPSDLSKPPAGSVALPAPPANNRDDEICIVAEKEGNRSGANSGRPVSVNSDHSIHRINGLVDDRPSSRQSIIHTHRNSPVVAGSHIKSDSAAVRSYGLPPSTLPSSYYSRSHLLPAAYGLPSAHHLAAGSAGMAAYAQDPRMSMMSHPAMLAGVRPANPFDPVAYGSVDPFRDPYRTMDMFRDPLREAREMELMRISEMDRAKVGIRRCINVAFLSNPLGPGG